MKTKEKAAKIVFKALDELNEQLSGKNKIKKSLDTVLFGQKGCLDSLGLVNLIVAVEQEIEEEFKRHTFAGQCQGALYDQKSFSHRRFFGRLYLPTVRG